MKHFGTTAIHAGQDAEQWGCKSVVPPIFNATTFKQHSPGMCVGVYFNCHELLISIKQGCNRIVDYSV